MPKRLNKDDFESVLNMVCEKKVSQTYINKVTNVSEPYIQAMADYVLIHGQKGIEELKSRGCLYPIDRYSMSYYGHMLEFMYMTNLSARLVRVIFKARFSFLDSAIEIRRRIGYPLIKGATALAPLPSTADYSVIDDLVKAANDGRSLDECSVEYSKKFPACLENAKYYTINTQADFRKYLDIPRELQLDKFIDCYTSNFAIQRIRTITGLRDDQIADMRAFCSYHDVNELRRCKGVVEQRLYSPFELACIAEFKEAYNISAAVIHILFKAQRGRVNYACKLRKQKNGPTHEGAYIAKLPDSINLPYVLQHIAKRNNNMQMDELTERYQKKYGKKDPIPVLGTTLSEENRRHRTPKEKDLGIRGKLLEQIDFSHPAIVSGNSNYCREQRLCLPPVCMGRSTPNKRSDPPRKLPLSNKNVERNRKDQEQVKKIMDAAGTTSPMEAELKEMYPYAYPSQEVECVYEDKKPYAKSYKTHLPEPKLLEEHKSKMQTFICYGSIEVYTMIKNIKSVEDRNKVREALGIELYSSVNNKIVVADKHFKQMKSRHIAIRVTERRVSILELLRNNGIIYLDDGNNKAQTQSDANQYGINNVSFSQKKASLSSEHDNFTQDSLMNSKSDNAKEHRNHVSLDDNRSHSSADLGRSCGVAGGSCVTASGSYADTVGGSCCDTAGGSCVTASGSCADTVGGSCVTASGSCADTVGGSCCDTAGGSCVTASGSCADTVGGSCCDTVGGSCVTASGSCYDTAGGSCVTASGSCADTAGGSCVTASGSCADTAGGSCVTASGSCADTAGGSCVTASGSCADTAGGSCVTASGSCADTVGGSCVTASGSCADTAGGSCVTASGSCADTAGESCVTASGSCADTVGGSCVTASGSCADTVGGSCVTASGSCADTAGGSCVTASGSCADTVGGSCVTASGSCADTAGGSCVTASGSCADTAGGSCVTVSGSCVDTAGGSCIAASGSRDAVDAGGSCNSLVCSLSQDAVSALLEYAETQADKHVSYDSVQLANVIIDNADFYVSSYEDYVTSEVSNTTTNDSEFDLCPIDKDWAVERTNFFITQIMDKYLSVETISADKFISDFEGKRGRSPHVSVFSEGFEKLSRDKRDAEIAFFFEVMNAVFISCKKKQFISDLLSECEYHGDREAIIAAISRDLCNRYPNRLHYAIRTALGTTKQKERYYLKYRSADVDERNRLITIVEFYINAIQDFSTDAFGKRKMVCLLERFGIGLSRGVVRRAMRRANRPYKEARQILPYFKTRTVDNANVVTDIVRKNFHMMVRFQVIFTDITIIRFGPSYEQTLYLAAYIDGYNGEILAYSISWSANMAFIVAGLNELAKVVGDLSRVVIHTDRGSHYLNQQFVDKLTQIGVTTRSMSPLGDCDANALIECWHRIIKKEFLQRKIDLKTANMIDIIISLTISIWLYNNVRPSSRCDGYSPVVFANRYSPIKNLPYENVAFDDPAINELLEDVSARIDNDLIEQLKQFQKDHEKIYASQMQGADDELNLKKAVPESQNEPISFIRL